MEKKSIDFAAVPVTAIKVITTPAVFFREMPKTGGYVEPLVFMAIMAAVAGLVQAILAILGFNIGAGTGTAISSIIVFPIVIAIFGFIGAAIAFVIWKFMGSTEPYETAYRCFAYLAALWPLTTILGVIPYIGMVLAIALMVYYYGIASIETHKIAPKTAWLVSGIIGVILLAMAISGGMASRSQALKYQKQLEEMQRKMENR